MNVGQVFGYTLPVPCTPHVQVAGVTRVGIEIELENISSSDLNTEYWRSITDGSLRNSGREFVFNGPHGGTDLFLACVELDTFLSRQSPDGSWRCSTHVHVDVRDLTSEQLKNVLLTYLVYEKLLFRLSGFQRYTNNFCSAFGFAQHQLSILAQNWTQEGEQFFHYVANSWDKYSALNLRPLANFGSIEFRLSAAEWRKGKLIRLANRFLSLRDFGAAWNGTQEELINHLASINPRDVMKKGIPPKDLPPSWAEDISVGVKLAYDLLAASNGVEQPSAIPSYTPDSAHVRVNTDTFLWMIGLLESDCDVSVRDNSPRSPGVRKVDCSFVEMFCGLVNVPPEDVVISGDMATYRTVEGTVMPYDDDVNDDDDGLF